MELPILEKEKQIEALLQQMTLEEKVSLCHANSLFTSTGVPRLGIDDLVMSDGPHGLRQSIDKDTWDFLDIAEDACTYLPTGTALAATWNPELARRFGETLGAEAKYRRKDVILGPGINIIRTPLGGRNFEYFSEDPCLISQMAPEVVKGIQSQGVAACVKHFCLNNQELDRFSVDVEVSPRALWEIYLPGFHAALMDGRAWSVMGAYNRYKGQHCCHNAALHQILNEKWKYPGVMIADWGGCHDTHEAIENGLDIEMGSGADYHSYHLADAFLAEAKKSESVRLLLDEKVRRILRLMLNIREKGRTQSPGAYNTRQHQQVAYDIAKEAMVLLKNDDNLLPLQASAVRKLLVVGPNAAATHASGGNSSGVKALYEITPLEGLRNRFGDNMQILYHDGNLSSAFENIPVKALNIIDTRAGCSAFKQIAYAEDKQSSVVFSDSGVVDAGTATRYDISASITIHQGGTHTFRFSSDGWIDVSLISKCEGEMKDIPSFDKASAADGNEITYAHSYQQGDIITLRARVKRINATVSFHVQWMTPGTVRPNDSMDALLWQAKQTDAVIYCGGLNHSLDCEGFDRQSMALPEEQDKLIPLLLEANPNTVVVITAGSPVTMPWLPQAKAVLWSWYAGMEGGHALADILFGAVSPSGKLPFTLPVQYSDTPVSRYGEYQAGTCRYNEGVLVGYRGYDYDGIAPMFPFGHGLSYAEFAYRDLVISRQGEGVQISFMITNIGHTLAAETAQLYIGDPIASVMRPPKELKGFLKVWLQPGESKMASFMVSTKDLSFYDEQIHDFTWEPGAFSAMIDSSSRDIRLTGTFEMEA